MSAGIFCRLNAKKLISFIITIQYRASKRSADKSSEDSSLYMMIFFSRPPVSTAKENNTETQTRSWGPQAPSCFSLIV